MIEWSKIDNEKKFQRLVNHIFSYGCNSLGFIPSSPYIGADGGWDGYYNGYYNDENLSGIWSIQAKWTLKNFSDAQKALEKEILGYKNKKGELYKAIDNKVDHLRIFTNAELKVEQVKKLEKLKEKSKKIKTLKIYGRESLTMKVEKASYIKTLFFDVAQSSAFVPGNQYFASHACEAHLIDKSLSLKPIIKKYLKPIISFIENNSSILIIHSPGGYGKTHFLREMPECIYNISSHWKTLFTLTGIQSMKSAINDELDKDSKYVVILDDADKSFEDVKTLINYAIYNSNRIKLIISSRTSSMFYIQEIINELKCNEITESLDFKKWTPNELIQLLRLITKSKKHKNEDEISQYCANPYIITWVGNKIINNINIDYRTLQKKFINDIEYEVIKIVKQLSLKIDLSDFLLRLTLLIPFKKDDDKIIEYFSKKNNILPDSFKKLIDKLIEAGIIRTIGNKIRFSPDIKGDLYLAYKTEKVNKSDISNFIYELLDFDSTNIFTNIEASSRYSNSPTLKAVLTELVNNWFEDKTNIDFIKINKRLNISRKIANIIPNEILDLLFEYIDLIDKYTIDYYSPIILKLSKFPELKNNIIVLLEKLMEKNIRSTYGNNNSEGLVKNLVSPIENEINSIVNTLAILDVWVSDLNENRLKLLTSALSELLQGTHEYSNFYINKMTIGAKALVSNEDNIKIRILAIKILKKLLINDNVDVKLTVLEILNSIGKTSFGYQSETELPLAETFAKERRELIDEIGQLLNVVKDCKFLDRVQNMFINWWAQKKPGTENVTEHLLKYPDYSEFELYKLLSESECYNLDFKSIVRRAPFKNRWNWYIKNCRKHNFQFNYDEAYKTIDNIKCNKTIKIIDLLIKIDNYNQCYNLYKAIKTFNYWIKKEKKIFFDIYKNKSFFNLIPAFFREIIIIIFCEIDKKYIDDLLKSESNFEISITEILIKSIVYNCYDDKTIEYILSKFNYTDSHTNQIILSNYKYIVNKISTKDTAIKYFVISLSKSFEINTGIINSICDVVCSIKQNITIIDEKMLEILKNLLRPLLIKIEKLDYEAQKILKFVSKDILDVINILDKRLDSKRKNINYEPIPYGGLEILNLFIKNINDYELMINNVFLWNMRSTKTYNYYIEYLMNGLIFLPDKEKNISKCYIIKIINDINLSNDIDKALFLLSFLPLRKTTISYYIKISDYALNNGNEEKLKDIYVKKSICGDMSGLLGEIPAALIERKNIFEIFIAQLHPGKLKNFVKKYLKYIEDEIERCKIENEEIFNPRI